MRIALLADLHGNLCALDAALEDIAATGGADVTLALGDLAMLGPQPAEVVDRLRETGCVAIQGNTDAWYNQTPAEDVAARDERLAGIIRYAHWAKTLLGEERTRYLLDLPFSWQADLGGGERLLAVHGSPRRIDEPILPDAQAEVLDDILSGVSASVLAFGHTHRGMVRRHKGVTLVNPGSLGNPIPPEMDARAAYGLVTWENGRLEIVLRRLAYDPSATLAAAVNRQMPGAAGYVTKFQQTG
jgi:predicted phosphodiesterase